jgi:nitroreductase
MRRLKPDPVPDGLIVKILEAGTRAPNGANSQTWRFIVVKDVAIKKAVEYLTEHFHEAPVWVVACIKHNNPLIPANRMAGASIYPAVQNMLLAARALGLGASLTTRHLLFEEETEKALELPEGVHSYAIIPIGYPIGNFGPVSRGDLRDFVSLDRIGQPWSALD